MSDKQRQTKGADINEAYTSHPRHFQGSQLIYPVLSRRSRGISIGVNLCPNKKCNFNCLYCQVARPPKAPPDKYENISLNRLKSELVDILGRVLSGQIYNFEPFDKAPRKLRRLNDIALSGDGEPTAAPDFLNACKEIIQVKRELSLEKLKIVLITNSSLLDMPEVQEGLKLLDVNQGEIWAKLDAGNESFFQFVNRSSVPFEQILKNITQAAQIRPIVIQSLFMRLDGRRVSQSEVAAYAERLAEIVQSGGQIISIQLHTIARPPRQTRVSALTAEEVDEIAREINQIVEIPIDRFYGFAPDHIV